MYKEIITTVVTTVGAVLCVYFGYYLSENAKTNDNRKVFLTETISKAEVRTLRAEMVIWSARVSETFEKRWDSYIENGFIPWTASYARTELGLIKLYPNKPQYLNMLHDLNNEYYILHTSMVNDIHTPWSRKLDIDTTNLKRLQEKLAALEQKSKNFSVALWAELNDLN